MTTDQKASIAPGQIFEFDYPFIEEYVVVHGYDEKTDSVTQNKVSSWRPGTIIEGDCHGDSVAIAHGVGKQSIALVSIHRPGRFPTRVFYLRRWVTPDGKEFGKPKLLIKTASAFRTLVAGYRYPYEVEKV